MDTLETHSHKERKARTRSLIQLGAPIDKADLLETFGIVLGKNLQKDPKMKEPVAAFLKVCYFSTKGPSQKMRPPWILQSLEALAKRPVKN